MRAPFFSITLPVYNAAPYLDQAIANLLNQDHRHFEIIAVDDGSTDGSLEILERHARADPRLQVFSADHGGEIAATNEALRRAKADLVAVMHADDICYPGRLSRQAAAFEADPHLAMCGTDYDEIIGARLYPSEGRAALAACDLRILSLFFTLFTHSTIAFNRAVIGAEALHYDPDYTCVPDFELTRRVAARHRVALIPERLLAYRIHPDSISSRQRKRVVRMHLRVVAENLARDLGVDTGCLEELGRGFAEGRIAGELSDRVGRCLLEIERRAGTAAPADLPSYRLGLENLFRYLCGVFRDHDPALLCRFLDATGKWALAPRRDRLWLGAWRRSRLLGSAMRQVAGLAGAAAARRRHSVPVASVLPPLAASGEGAPAAPETSGA